MRIMIWLVIAIGFALAACQSQPQQLTPLPLLAEEGSLSGQVAAVGDTHWLVSGAKGLALVDRDGRITASLEGQYELVDTRASVALKEPGDALAIVMSTQTKAPLLIRVDVNRGQLHKLNALTAPNYQVEGLCLYRDHDKNVSLFLLDGAGRADQWLIFDGLRESTVESHVRSLIVPPGSEYCSVDDQRGSLYVSEESFGLWRYSADPEREQERVLIDAIAPFGSLSEAVAGVAVAPSGPVVVTPDTQQLHFYDWAGKKSGVVNLDRAKEPEALALLSTDGHRLMAAVYDDELASVRQFEAPLPQEGSSGGSRRAPYPTVFATAQTDPVKRFGDAADDPAIWVHPGDPKQSLILGSDKKWGLRVYNLAGQEVQSLQSGHINNVDVRQGVLVGETEMDIAVGSNRSNNAITVYGIQRHTGEVSEIGAIATGLSEVYGICLYKDARAQAYVFINDKDGRYQQFALQAQQGGVAGTLVREFALTGQPEACVADDRTGQLFMGEEDRGVWLTGADPNHPDDPELILEEGAVLQADVEGLGLYLGEEQSYLVVSSQGDDSYAIFETRPPFAHRGSFRIGINVGAGIDGASETDGLEVTSVGLGGSYGRGLLVVQDGRNVMPHQPQNFKLVPWSAVAELLQLP